MRAVHVRTGDRSTDTAIAAWLERHDAEVVACADAFDACRRLIKKPELEPDLALIGADWLPSDESAIVGYFRDVWPNVVTVIYGTSPATAAFANAARVTVIRSVSQMRGMLADVPATLLENARQAIRTRAAEPQDEWQPRLAADMEEPEPDNITPNPPRVSRVEEEPEANAPEQTGQSSSEDPSIAAAPPVTREFPDARAAQRPPHDDILSDEELTALLDDEDH